MTLDLFVGFSRYSLTQKFKHETNAYPGSACPIISSTCQGHDALPLEVSDAKCRVIYVDRTQQGKMQSVKTHSLVGAGPRALPTISKLNEDLHAHQFMVPVKKINEGEDVQFFLTSKAYKDIVTWILMLNVAMFPREAADGKVTSWPTGSSPQNLSPMVVQMQSLLIDLHTMIEQNPPDTGPRRFGNIAFRTWHAMLEAKMDDLLEQYIPEKLQRSSAGEITPLAEMKAYLLGSFGSAQRLDYGTGHELSFLAFLACLWKLGAFANSEEGVEERAIVLQVLQP